MILLRCGPLHANTINVPEDQPTIQLALNVAAMGDTILVQPGIYFENLVWPNTQDLKLLAVGDTSNTVVDGGALGRVLSITSDVGSTTLIRGIRFTNGISADWADGTGAGIYTMDAVIRLERIVVDACVGSGARCYGAGISINGGSVDLHSSWIHHNVGMVATGHWSHGGGIYAIDASLKLDSVQFSDNLIGSMAYAKGGGGYFETSFVVLTDCKFNDNEMHGTWYNYGGGLYIRETLASIVRCTFSSNMMFPSQINSGGGLHANSSNIQIEESVMIGNQMQPSDQSYGAGLFTRDSQLQIDRCDISYNLPNANSVCKGFGACFVGTGSVTISNVLISRNYASGSATSWFGGGISVESPSCSIDHATIVDNKRYGFPGSGAVEGRSLHGSMVVRNSICRSPGLGAQIAWDSSGTMPEATYSNILGSWPGIGNIDLPPGFVSGTDYHLTSSSPCLAQGDTSDPYPVDLDGLLRPMPNGTAPDMGAYEEQTMGPLNTSICCDATLCLGEVFQFNGSVQGGVPPYAYAWSPTTGLSDPMVIDPIASPETTTTYTLIVTDATGSTNTSTMSVDVEVCTALDEGKERPAIVVRPVPFNNELTIDTRTSGYLSVTVSDPLGRLVVMPNTGRSPMVIDTHSWPAGPYFLRIETGGSLFHQRVIKD
ncbi:MAG: T9SS type A sorting domain-containing protein [Flavobacteriales bacterium]|nr:T9SS type A sorting domain-containing protein [Flavobacteriales bacterium]